MAGKVSIYGNKWRVVESLSEGGQGFVYKVIDTTAVHEGQYLLKRLKNPKRLDRFKREIRALQDLVHPNILKIVDAEPEHEPPFLVTVLCAGDLAGNVSYYPDLLSRLRLFRGVCQGVAAAHSGGIIHRDLKPENILINDDLQPVVADFGLCYVEEGERHTLVDEAIGPRRFIAPELEEGRADEISPRSDVYSLGKLLYWLIAGDIFTREKHREDRYNLVKRLGDTRLERVNRILDRMITLDPAVRYANAGELLEEVNRIVRAQEGGFNVISPGLPQTCVYCGEGTYRDCSGQTPPLVKVEYQHAWRQLACDICGHVQLFCLMGASKRNEWWGYTER